MSSAPAHCPALPQQSGRPPPQPMPMNPRGRVGFCMWLVGPLIYVWGGYEVHETPHSLPVSDDDDVDDDDDDDDDFDDADDGGGDNIGGGGDHQEFNVELMEDADAAVGGGFGGVAGPQQHQQPQHQLQVYFRQSSWVHGDRLLCYCTDSQQWVRLVLRIRDLTPDTHQHRVFHSGFSGSACCANGDDTQLYISGGFNEAVHHSLSATNAVYAIHVNRNRQIDQEGYPVTCLFSMETGGPAGQTVPMPRDKHSAIYWHNRLLIFGGYCLNPPTTLINSVDYCGAQLSLQGVFYRPECFQPNDSLRFAWSNELLQFDLATGAWTQLDPDGAPPSPRAAHSMIRVGGDRALLFGGRVLDRRTNDLFCLSLDSDRMQWTRLQPHGSLPEPRSWTTFVQVGPRQVFCFGGYPWANPPAMLHPFSNCFLYDLSENRFRRLLLPERPGLLWHGSCAQLSNGSAYIWGGCTEDIMLPTYSRDFNSRVLQFPRLLVPPLAALCADLVVHSPGLYPLSFLAKHRPVADGIIQRRRLMYGPLRGG